MDLTDGDRSWIIDNNSAAKTKRYEESQWPFARLHAEQIYFKLLDIGLRRTKEKLTVSWLKNACFDNGIYKIWHSEINSQTQSTIEEASTRLFTGLENG